jgi:hypothetical protein
MTQHDAMRKLAATRTEADYNRAVEEIRVENGGQLPEWFRSAIILSGFEQAKKHQWSIAC